MSTARIRELNDTFRLDPQRWGSLMITCGVQEMGAAFVGKAIIAARTFDRFTPNPPVAVHERPRRHSSYRPASRRAGEPLVW
jgi:hypothetical protein